ncbi:MAG: polyphenol oxidase family protein [Gemmatimonadetes bacterium]|nr:polyphenol oxidase family protein [Gemmatimonadota bacterium]
MTAGDVQRLDETAHETRVPLLDLTAWRETHGIVAGITARTGEFDLGLASLESTKAVTARWRAFFAEMRPAFSGFVMSFHAHRATIASYGPDTKGWVIGDGLDGHATTDAGILLMVPVADCVPVYLLHPPTNTLALLHAGWRGIADGILESGLASVAELSGDPRPSEVIMHCGVGICGDCYEVGHEVFEAVTGSAVSGRVKLDLRVALTDRARRAGVGTITATQWCSAHDRDRFFSHRRSGGTDGRMVAYLGRPRG